MKGKSRESMTRVIFQRREGNKVITVGAREVEQREWLGQKKDCGRSPGWARDQHGSLDLDNKHLGRGG